MQTEITTSMPLPHVPGRHLRGLLSRLLPWGILLLSSPGLLEAGKGEPENLAIAAKASAFEAYEGMTAALANDGNPETRWSGIPGHNAGLWYELTWQRPVRIAELVVFQYDRYVNEMDVEVWDDSAGAWLTVGHLGRPGEKLPRVVIYHPDTRTALRLRLANITGGPSFTEVQVFDRVAPRPPAVNLASDARGNFIGIVSDLWGSVPVAGARVTVRGSSKRGSWNASAASDSNGLFFIPMPLGLTGRLTVTARASEAAPGDSIVLDAASFQYGLTPRNLYRQSTELSSGWRFAPDPPDGFWKSDFDDSRWASINVPAHFIMEGFRSSLGVGGYRTRFRVPPGIGRVILRFEGVYSGAEVWVNGRLLACHEGGALPFEADITQALQGPRNVLALRVTEHTIVSDRLDKMSEYADFPLAGIMRPVYLFRVPETHIGALEITTVFDSAFRDAVVKGRIAVLNESPEPLSDMSVELRLLDQKKAAKASLRLPLEAADRERSELDFTLPVKAPAHWEAEHPRLYTLELILRSGDRELERLAERIGFRQTDIAGDQLLINGRSVKIRGTCHHDSHPMMGRAVTAALTRQDLEMMKEANLNALRTSHYPPRAELLDIADEIGIYVEDEGSFCWADAADDLRITPRIMQLNAELLARDRNHPSVFLWSVCNESSFGYGFERSHEWMRRADPDRPDAGSYDKGSLEVRARHNPITPGGIAESGKYGKPVLWDESWCIYQGIWNDVGEMWVDPGIRDYYAEPLQAIYKLMMESRPVMGTQIWAWSDDIFSVPDRGLEYGRGATRVHFIENEYRVPGRGLTGDAPWGVVDGWRRRKPEFWITKKLHSPLKIVEAPLELPNEGGAVRVTAANEYDFTNLSELTTVWQIADEKGKVHPSIPPHRSGTIEVRPAKPLRAGDVLRLRFTDKDGHEVDSYDLTIGEPAHELPALERPSPGNLVIMDENYLSGRGTRVIGRDFEYAFDHGTGRLRRAVAFGRAILLDLPTLHILRASSPESPGPDPLSWQLRNLDIRPDGDNVRVRIDGSYEGFAGGYDVLISQTGGLTVRSSFVYGGDTVKAREIGMAFSVPMDLSILSWERKGEWSVYPGDHIGRTRGEAPAFIAHPEKVPPVWPWAEDNSPMGSNDFRSTKRHIYWASISCGDGAGAWVVSDGSQHVRATVGTDRISLYVSDWYGGTNTGLWEWTSNYGEGKTILRGERLESEVRLVIAKGKDSRKRQ